MGQIKNIKPDYYSSWGLIEMVDLTHFRPLGQKSGKNRLFWGDLLQDTSVSIWSFLTFDWFQELKVPNTRLHLVRQYPYFMMGPGSSIIDLIQIPYTNWPLFKFWFIVLTINDAFILSEIINTHLFIILDLSAVKKRHHFGAVRKKNSFK